MRRLPIALPIVLFFVSLLAAVVLAACTTGPKTTGSDATRSASTSATIVPSPPDPGYRLVFDSGFGGTSLDSRYWKDSTRYGRRPGGIVNSYAAHALKVSDEMLTMQATAQPSWGRDYTSGGICTYGKYSFTYGYIEMRAKLPKGQGLWPAFWLASTGTPKRTELDIMEVLGQRPLQNNMVYHYLANDGGYRRVYHTSKDGPDFSSGFHRFALEWTRDRLVWYIDGVERFRIDAREAALYDITWPSDPVYITANLAVGGWALPPKSDAVFPADFVVDYIRVYQK